MSAGTPPTVKEHLTVANRDLPTGHVVLWDQEREQLKARILELERENVELRYKLLSKMAVSGVVKEPSQMPPESTYSDGMGENGLILTDYPPAPVCEDSEDDDPTPPKCESCGVPWVDHLGMIGTCRKLQGARAEIERMKAVQSAFWGVVVPPDEPEGHEL